MEAIALERRTVNYPMRFTTMPMIKEATPFKYKGVGISGKMCVGKTTLASFIEQEYGIERRSLATALKNQVVDALVENGIDCKRADLLGQHKGKIRGILQQWGVAFREFNGEDYWIDCLFEDGNYYLVVDDVRFPNEFEALRKRGFLMVRLSASNYERDQRMKTLYEQVDYLQSTHESETALDLYDSKFDIILFSQPTPEETFAAFKREASRFGFGNDL